MLKSSSPESHGVSKQIGQWAGQRAESLAGAQQARRDRSRGSSVCTLHLGTDNWQVQEPVKTPTVTLITEEDFVQACKNPSSGEESEADKLALRELVVGQPVDEQEKTTAQLQAEGYQSWGEYVACSFILEY